MKKTFFLAILFFVSSAFIAVWMSRTTAYTEAKFSISTATTTRHFLPYVYEFLAPAKHHWKGSCLKLEESDQNGGFTYITASEGSLIVSQVPCDK